MVDGVIVIDKMNNDGYAKTYFYDHRTKNTYIKRDFIKNMTGRASAANFSNQEVSIKDAIESINWAVSQKMQVNAYVE